jgi:RNA recognition motif-containing protein
MFPQLQDDSDHERVETAPKRKRHMDAFLEELKRQEKEAEEKSARMKELAQTVNRNIEAAESTNLFLSNLPADIHEGDVVQECLKFGAIASVKLMPPRAGFVCYMTREDAEKALHQLNGKEWMGVKVRAAWGKPQPLPKQPLYEPALSDAVQVIIPADMVLRRVIHRTVERVVRYGMAFEVWSNLCM